MTITTPTLSTETLKPQLNSSFLQRLQSPDRPVIIFDGTMGTNLQSQNLTAEDFGGAEYEGCSAIRSSLTWATTER